VRLAQICWIRFWIRQICAKLRSVQIWGIDFGRLAVRPTQMTSRFVRPLYVCVKHRSVFYTEYVFQVAPSISCCPMSSGDCSTPLWHTFSVTVPNTTHVRHFFVTFVTLPESPQVCFWVPLWPCVGGPFCIYIPSDVMPRILSLNNAGCVLKADNLQFYISLSEVERWR